MVKIPFRIVPSMILLIIVVEMWVEERAILVLDSVWKEKIQGSTR